MESTLRRTWAEIDLDALAYNYHALRRRVGADVKFLGVVKADGYGHGAVQCAVWLDQETLIPRYAEFSQDGQVVLTARMTTFSCTTATEE